MLCNFVLWPPNNLVSTLAPLIIYFPLSHLQYIFLALTYLQTQSLGSYHIIVYCPLKHHHPPSVALLHVVAASGVGLCSMGVCRPFASTFTDRLRHRYLAFVARRTLL
jgi:hypothetical protein